MVARFEVRRLVRQHEKSDNWWKDLLRLRLSILLVAKRGLPDRLPDFLHPTPLLSQTLPPDIDKQKTGHAAVVIYAKPRERGSAQRPANGTRTPILVEAMSTRVGRSTSSMTSSPYRIACLGLLT